MKRLAIIIPALLFAAQASAISRYQTTSMSCARVTAVLAAEGAAILRFQSPRNPSVQLFDRYVRDSSFCSYGQRATASSVPAADRKDCPVRKCVRISSGNGNR